MKLKYIYVIISQILVFLIIAFTPIKPKPYGDPDFFPEAKQLSQMLKGVKYDYPLIIDKAPLPSLLYTVPFLFVDGDDSELQKAAVFFNLIFAILGVVFFVKAVDLLMGSKSAYLGLLFLTTFPMHLYYSFGVNAEVYSFTFVSLIIYFFVRYYTNKGSKNLIWSFLFIFILLFVRPNAVLILPILAFLSLLFYFIRKEKIYLKLVSYSIVVFVSFMISMSLVAEIQKVHTKDRAQDTYLLWVINQGYYQFRTEPLDWRTWQSTHKEGSIDYENWDKTIENFDSLVVEYNGSKKFLIEEFYLKDFINNPFLKIRQIFTKAIFGQFFIVNSKPRSFYSFFSQSGNIEFYVFHLFINIFNLFALVLFIMYMVKYFKWDLDDLFFISLWLGFLVFHSLVYMEPRYLFTSRLVLILLSLKYLHYRFNKSKEILV